MDSLPGLPDGDVTACRRRNRPAVAVITAMAMLVVPGMSEHAADAQAKTARGAQDLPALPSDPAPKPRLDLPVGDFNNPPPYPGEPEDGAGTAEAVQF